MMASRRKCEKTASQMGIQTFLPARTKHNASRLACTVIDSSECDQSSKNIEVAKGSTPASERMIHTRSGRNAPASRTHKGARGAFAPTARPAAKCAAYIQRGTFLLISVKMDHGNAISANWTIASRILMPHLDFLSF